MGNTPVKTSCRPSLRRRMGSVSICRKSRKLLSWTSSRLGIWRFQSRSILLKFLRSLRRVVFQASRLFSRGGALFRSSGAADPWGPTTFADCRPTAAARTRHAAGLEGGLLDLDGGALLFELGLHVGGFLLRDLVLHGLRSAIHQVLGLLEPESSQLAH